MMMMMMITSTTARRTPYADGVNNVQTGANVTATTGLHNETTGIETKRKAAVIHYCLNKWTTNREV
jgi:preprotein translocase subunit YajC